MNSKRKYFTYDFSNFDRISIEILDTPTNKTLSDLKNELNKFFKDAICDEVLLTRNTDKMFFGMTVMPSLRMSDLDDIVYGKERKVRIDKYCLEIDSKLLEIGLEPRELTACILHEVGHVVNDTQGTEEIKNAISTYIADRDKVISKSNSNYDRDILMMGVTLGISRINSLFNRDDEEVIADSFVVACGYGQELSNGYKKILSNSGKLSKQSRNKLVALQWCLSMLLNFKINRIPAIQALQVASKVEPSVLVKDQVNYTLKATKSRPVRESAIMDKIYSYYDKISYSDIRELEEELYEYDIRVKRVDTEDEALILAREINTRISILDDYLISKKLSSDNTKMCQRLIQQYRYLRTELTKKKLYGEKYYGLFVQTPVIKSRYDM